MKRLVIITAVVVAFASGAAGALTLRHSPTVATTSTTQGPPATRVSTLSPTVPVSTPPTTFPAHIYSILYAGCHSLQAVGRMLSQVPLPSGNASQQWRYVSDMQLVGSDPIYYIIAGDTRTFVADWSSARTTGNVTAVNGSIETLVVDCRALGLHPA